MTPSIRRAFVVYLASHNRPVHEVLFPAERDIAQEYERTFQGMTADTVELADLLTVRKRMTEELPGSLDTDERRLLRSLVGNKPDSETTDAREPSHRVISVPASTSVFIDVVHPWRRRRVAEEASTRPYPRLPKFKAERRDGRIRWP